MTHTMKGLQGHDPLDTCTDFMLNTVWPTVLMFQIGKGSKEKTERVRSSARASDENMFGPAPHPSFGCSPISQFDPMPQVRRSSMFTPTRLENIGLILHNGPRGDVRRLCVSVCVCVWRREGGNNCMREIEIENNRQSPPEAHLHFPV